MKEKFIKLTECYNPDKPQEIFLNAVMIEAMYTQGTITIVKHPSHNNCGWHIKETPQQILKLINELN